MGAFYKQTLWIFQYLLSLESRLSPQAAKTLRDWIQGRKIEYVKIGTRVLFTPEAIRKFIAENTRRAAV